MRQWLAVSLTLVGATIGGGFPGAWCAFSFSAGTGIGGSRGEAICFIANVILGIGGALCGMLSAKALKGTAFQRIDIVLPILLGSISGMAGYFWCDWAISHADPPL
jgi:hypothetical protein